jgi:hypothetical protein
MSLRHVVITDSRKINAYGDGLSYSGVMFILIFEKIDQLAQEVKSHTHKHTEERG